MCIKYICEKYLIDNNENEKVDLDKFYSFIKSEINKNINSLLVIPKNLLQKIYIHETIIF